MKKQATKSKSKIITPDVKKGVTIAKRRKITTNKENPDVTEMGQWIIHEARTG